MQRKLKNNNILIGKYYLPIFIDFSRASGLKVVLGPTGPMPIPQFQYGPTCGFYAGNAAMRSFSRQLALPARKRDLPYYKGPSLLSFRGEFRNQHPAIDLGAIYDTANFKDLAKCVNYESQILDFENENELVNLIEASVNVGLVPILPIDGSEYPLLTQGENAHYITVIGYVKKDGQMTGILYISHDNYWYAAIEAIFASCDNLLKTSATHYYKNLRLKDWEDYSSEAELTDVPVEDRGPKIKIPDIDLAKLRNKFILFYPPELGSIANNIVKAKNLKSHQSSPFLLDGPTFLTKKGPKDEERNFKLFLPLKNPIENFETLHQALYSRTLSNNDKISLFQNLGLEYINQFIDKNVESLFLLLGPLAELSPKLVKSLCEKFDLDLLHAALAIEDNLQNMFSMLPSKSIRLRVLVILIDLLKVDSIKQMLDNKDKIKTFKKCLGHIPLSNPFLKLFNEDVTEAENIDSTCESYQWKVLTFYYQFSCFNFVELEKLAKDELKQLISLIQNCLQFFEENSNLNPTLEESRALFQTFLQQEALKNETDQNLPHTSNMLGLFSTAQVTHTEATALSVAMSGDRP